MQHKPPPENFEMDIQVSQNTRVTYQQHIKRNWKKYNKYKKKKTHMEKERTQDCSYLEMKKMPVPKHFLPLHLVQPVGS